MNPAESWCETCHSVAWLILGMLSTGGDNKAGAERGWRHCGAGIHAGLAIPVGSNGGESNNLIGV